jgi:hypothetical protein
VSLPHEPGRHAFAARGETFAELAPAADEHVELAARAEHYAPAARAALHHLERRLFEPAGLDLGAADPPEVRAARLAPEVVVFDAPDAGGELRLFDDLAFSPGFLGAEPEPEVEPPGAQAGAGPDGPVVQAGDAVAFLAGGGERAELELVAAEVARLLAAGVPAEEVAVVVRRPDEAGALLAQVFAAYDVPVAVERTVPFGHTPLGRALVGLLRAAVGGTAADLLAWLRAPGLVRTPALVDRLEADVRRAGLRTAAQARARWEERRPDWPLDALDRVAAAVARGPEALLARAEAELVGLFAAPHRRAGQVLSAGEADDAGVLRAGRGALAELTGLAAADPALAPSAAELATLLEELAVPLGGRPAAGAVVVTDPLRVRARRVRALVRVPAAGRRVPRARPPRAVPRRRRAPRAQRGVRPAAAPARGRARRRAGAVLRDRLAAGGAPRARVARRRRRRRAGRAVPVRRGGRPPAR